MRGVIWYNNSVKIIPLIALILFAGLTHAEESVLPSDGVPEIRTAKEFFTLSHEMDTHRLTGVVNDAFIDDVDPRFMYLIMAFDGQNIPVSVKLDGHDPASLLKLIGGRVEVYGVLRSTSAIISRAFLGRMICVDSVDLVKPLSAISDPFSAPALELPEHNLPSDLAHMGNRRIKGRVLAVWGETEVFVQPESRQENQGPNPSASEIPVRVSLPPGTSLPTFNEDIEVVGNVETDTFTPFLTHAIWRPTDSSAPRTRTVKDVAIEQLFTKNVNGSMSFVSTFNGRYIRVKGTVRGLSGLDRGRFQLESGNHYITIDASSLPELPDDVERGCKVEITGLCVLSTDMWRESAIFPSAHGLLIIPCLPEDIHIVARAPWLTPERTTSILLIFTGCLIIFLIYNRVLWLRAFRRGKELSKETIARAEADMRTRERTRLAVELHDSLVQSLSGVIMELETARRSSESEDLVSSHHVIRAEKMLRSCHTDLRNCLWDLRSEALEEDDMKSAIERTLIPHVKDVALDIRFSVARVRLADNTAYMILRAIRELVLNGIKHGKATKIKVAGAIEGDKLLISVRDNGCGFDPDLAPSVLDGHFGLEGIRERLRNLSGTFDITSAPGNGSRAVLTIPVHKGESNS